MAVGPFSGINTTVAPVKGFPPLIRTPEAGNKSVPLPVSELEHPDKKPIQSVQPRTKAATRLGIMGILRRDNARCFEV
jgi:hypothetical protein